MFSVGASCSEKQGTTTALGAVLTDGLFGCIANIANQIVSRSVSTYAYQFDDENAPTRAAAG